MNIDRGERAWCTRESGHVLPWWLVSAATQRLLRLRRVHTCKSTSFEGRSDQRAIVLKTRPPLIFSRLAVTASRAQRKDSLSVPAGGRRAADPQRKMSTRCTPFPRGPQTAVAQSQSSAVAVCKLDQPPGGRPLRPVAWGSGSFRVFNKPMKSNRRTASPTSHQAIENSWPPRIQPRPAQPTQLAPSQLLGLSSAQVAKALGISLRKLRQLSLDDRFPKPIILGARTVRYKPDEVHEWLNRQPRGGLAEPAPLKHAREERTLAGRGGR